MAGRKRPIGIGRVAEASPVDRLEDEGGCTMFKRNTFKSEVIHDMLLCPSLASPPLCLSLSPCLPALPPSFPPLFIRLIESSSRRAKWKVMCKRHVVHLELALLPIMVRV